MIANNIVKNWVELTNKIEEFNTIFIFRHINPDGDAFGSQFGLGDFIKLNYSSKKIYLIGKENETNLKFQFDFNRLVFEEDEEIKKEIINSLAIVVDTPTLARIDNSELFKKAKYQIKIDHHPILENFENLSFQSELYSSCSEQIGEYILFTKKKYNKTIATSLFIGMITDSNRFLYQATSNKTFAIATKLVEKDIDLQLIYQNIYEKDLESTKFSSILIKKAHFENNLIWIKIKPKLYQKYNFSSNKVSLLIHYLQRIKNYNYLIYCVQDENKKQWRISLRSSNKQINLIAEKYGGGGHRYASGIKVQDEKVIDLIINDIRNIAN